MLKNKKHYDDVITMEEKRNFLIKNGWYTLWNEDNWLEEEKEYSNPDWAGIHTDQAYEKEMRKK